LCITSVIIQFHFKIHGPYNIKFGTAQQAKQAYKYMNIKKSVQINETIWFNKKSLLKQLTPKYISIKINGGNQQRFKTKKIATNIQ
jgi:hypothetical protein